MFSSTYVLSPYFLGAIGETASYRPFVSPPPPPVKDEKNPKGRNVDPERSDRDQSIDPRLYAPALLARRG